MNNNDEASIYSLLTNTSTQLHHGTLDPQVAMAIARYSIREHQSNRIICSYVQLATAIHLIQQTPPDHSEVNDRHPLPLSVAPQGYVDPMNRRWIVDIGEDSDKVDRESILSFANSIGETPRIPETDLFTLDHLSTFEALLEVASVALAESRESGGISRSDDARIRSYLRRIEDRIHVSQRDTSTDHPSPRHTQPTPQRNGRVRLSAQEIASELLTGQIERHKASEEAIWLLQSESSRDELKMTESELIGLTLLGGSNLITSYGAYAVELSDIHEWHKQQHEDWNESHWWRVQMRYMADDPGPGTVERRISEAISSESWKIESIRPRSLFAPQWNRAYVATLIESMKSSRPQTSSAEAVRQETIYAMQEWLHWSRQD